jgi:phosphoglycerol transferase MdoB-like AlkP superfamily enzyme
MKNLTRFFYGLWLILFLVVLFVLQNQIFNSFVHLTPNPDIFLFFTESFTLGLLLYGPAILFGKRTRYIYLFLMSLVVSIYFISQYLYFSFYGGFFQASALEYSGQVGAEWSTVLTLMTPKILVFLLSFLAVIIFFILERKGKVRSELLQGKEKALTALAMVIIVIFGYSYLAIKDGNGQQKISNPLQTLQKLDSFTFSPNYLVQKVGIGNYFLGDVIGTVLRSQSITKDDVAFVQNWFSKKPPETAGKYFGLESGKNLFYIQVESLESAVIGQKIGDQEITPNLNKLASEGLYFDNYYTQVGSGNTADAEFVTLNSLYPLINEVAFIDFAHNSFDAIPNLLIQHGYSTYSLHGDVPDFWNRVNIYPALGYEKSISKNDFTTKEAGFETLSDDDFFSQSAQKISTFKQPFMATLITLSSHTPFIIPEKYQSLQIPANSTLTDRQKNYLESIHYMDGALGSFIDKLKEDGMYDNSVIAIFGDHGSSTDISKELISPNDQTLDGLKTSRVPLILLASKLNTTLKGTISTPGSHVDLYPTVANLLGIKPPHTVLGQDLLNTKTPVITRRGPYSQIITTIVTPTMAYESSDSGIFEEGKCITLPQKTALPIDNCKTLYDQQSETFKVSDLVIKGNLIPSL